jgi:hypothetical protein
MVAGRGEVRGEQPAADRPGGEAGDPQVAASGDHQQRQSESPDGARDLGRRRRHATTTVVTAE